VRANVVIRKASAHVQHRGHTLQKLSRGDSAAASAALILAGRSVAGLMITPIERPWPLEGL